MAKSNLAHDEQLLKHLDQTLKEIGDQHRQMYDQCFTMQMNMQDVVRALNEPWSKVINLFVTTEDLRKSRREQDQSF